jgi:hypothetical protein
VLLFVFWYCHKRGKEVRLEKERNLTEDELQKLDAEFKAEYGDDMPTTTAEAGASIEDVKAGVKEAAALREAGMEEDAVTEKAVDPAIIPPTTVP